MFPENEDPGEPRNQERQLRLEVVAGNRCRLTSACEPALPQIAADIGQLRHIVLSLLIRAAEAIGDGPGEIQVRTGWRKCDAAYLGRTRNAPARRPHPKVRSRSRIEETV
jgi:nitrogen-specific signal transduction histidine kinase